jgi:hypothetical protein
VMPTLTAIHEAGHAVAAVVLRRYFRRVSIVPRGDLAGRTSGWGYVDYSHPRNRRRMAVITYASFVAEVRYRQRRGDDSPMPIEEVLGSQQDTRHLELFGYRDDHEVIADAVEIVVQHWKAVLRVAEALDATKTLTHKQVADRVRAAR